MPGPFEALSSLDPILHGPARLAILTALAACRRADFLYLQSLTGLEKGNLSRQLYKLEEAALLVIEKGYTGRKGRIPHTQVCLTERGRELIAAHWRQLDDLRQEVERWQPNGDDPSDD